MARPSKLADPEFAKQVAEAFVEGCSRQEMADTFGVKDLDTITAWRRDPRVKAHALKLVEDRVLRITRRTDSVIEARLQHADQMTVKEILDIRKEFLGGALRSQTEKADEQTITEAMQAIENNPALVEDLAKLLDSNPAPAAAE